MLLWLVQETTGPSATPNVEAATIAAIASVAAAVIALLGTALTAVLTYRSKRQEELIKARLVAYQKLWTVMQDFSPTSVTYKEDDVTVTDCQRAESKLRAWYFSDGGHGIFLSRETQKEFVNVMKKLIFVQSAVQQSDTQVLGREQAKKIVDLLSGLRTSTKNEIGVYGKVPRRRDDTSSPKTVAELFASPPLWLATQVELYRGDPDRHIDLLCSAVAAAILGDGARSGAVRDKVEKELERREELR